MKTADLITSYLNNEMTPEQERQFLLSVAASDSLRLSLKSHVMLDKIVTNEIQRAHVPESVRESIFSQMRSSVGGAAPTGAAAAAGVDAAETAGVSALGRFLNNAAWRFGRGALVGLLVVGGFAAGYMTRSEIVPAASTTTASAPAESRPVTGVPAAPASAPATETASEEVNGAAAEMPSVASTSSERVASAPPLASDRESRMRAGAPALRRGDARPVGAGDERRSDDRTIGTNAVTSGPKADVTPRDTTLRANSANATVQMSIERPDQENTRPDTKHGGAPDQ